MVAAGVIITFTGLVVVEVLVAAKSVFSVDLALSVLEIDRSLLSLSVLVGK